MINSLLNVKRRQFLLETLRIVIVIAIALGIGFGITALVSEEPVAAFSELLTGPLPTFDGVPTVTFGGDAGWITISNVRSLNRFGDWMADSFNLILIGLSVAIVFSARQFSLGAEGQIFIGALAAAAIALYLPSPIFVHIPLAVLAAGAAGFLWGLIPGVLKAYVQADEIVSTLMLNIIALQIYRLLLTQYMRDPDAGFIATEFFPITATLPVMITGTRITIALFIVIIAVVATWFIMARTPLGYEIKMVGANLKFARYGGINTKWVIAMSMAVSGIFAGLAGAHLAMGMLRQLTLNMSQNLGFEGIVVALLARNDPKGVVIAGLFYAYLRTGAQIMERSSDVTREVVLVIQAIIILLITAERVLPLIQEWWRRRKAPDELLSEAETPGDTPSKAAAS